MFSTSVVKAKGVGGQPLTLTRDAVGSWGKFFRYLLKPTVTSSAQGAEGGDLERDSSIPQATVSEVVTKVLSGKTLGVDKLSGFFLCACCFAD